MAELAHQPGNRELAVSARQAEQGKIRLSAVR